MSKVEKKRQLSKYPKPDSTFEFRFQINLRHRSNLCAQLNWLIPSRKEVMSNFSSLIAQKFHTAVSNYRLSLFLLVDKLHRVLVKGYGHISHILLTEDFRRCSEVSQCIRLGQSTTLLFPHHKVEFLQCTWYHAPNNTKRPMKKTQLNSSQRIHQFAQVWYSALGQSWFQESAGNSATMIDT
jgi:hypothetical protein